MERYIAAVAFANDLATRLHGPGAFRFYLQPAVAALFAIVDGVKDARAGRPAFLWDAFRGGPGRPQRLRTGLQQVTTPFAVAVVLDVMFQWVVMREIHFGAAFLVGAALIWLPYVLLRGPVNRLLTLVRPRHHAPTP